MRVKIVLAVVLCLAVVALLGVAAAPAAAQGSCDCHTAVPPTNGAPAAHAPYVVSVTDCATCHVDWAVPHPDSWRSVLALSGAAQMIGYRLSGWVGVHIGGLTPITKGHPGVVVYLQRRLWGATAFTDLTPVTTDANGRFTRAVFARPAYATYRAVSQGHVGVSLFSDATALFRPRVTTLLPTPTLTGALHGRFTGGQATRPRIRLGNRVSVRGSLAPADLATQFTVRAQKYVDRRWVTRSLTVTPTVIGTGTATATYSWKWTPKSRGVFRVYVRIAATDASTGTGFLAPYGRYTTFRVW